MCMGVLARYILLIEKTIATVKRPTSWMNSGKNKISKKLKVSKQMSSKDKNRESFVLSLSNSYVITQNHMARMHIITFLDLGFCSLHVSFFYHKEKLKFSTRIYWSEILAASDNFDLFPQSINGTLSGLRQFLSTESSFKNDEKCFLFHLKSFLHSQDISILVLIFWSYRKTVWLER